jgi:hypothetical protein
LNDCPDGQIIELTATARDPERHRPATLIATLAADGSAAKR